MLEFEVEVADGEADVTGEVVHADGFAVVVADVGGFYGGGSGEDHLSFTQGGGHGGSHPHLVHQFVQLLRGEGEGYPNAVQSANITLTGILAHESALKNGEIVRLPEWSFS